LIIFFLMLTYGKAESGFRNGWFVARGG